MIDHFEEFDTSYNTAEFPDRWIRDKADRASLESDPAYRKFWKYQWESDGPMLFLLGILFLIMSLFFTYFKMYEGAIIMTPHGIGFFFMAYKLKIPRRFDTEAARLHRRSLLKPSPPSTNPYR